MPARLYLDNAATSFPKPPGVLEAMQRYAEQWGASAGRGAYREALETGQMVAECRGRLARLIGAESPERVVFTLNCSMALNQALKGLLRQDDHVVTSTMEHNSVLRPLHALKEQRGVCVTHVRADPATGRVDPGDMVKAISLKTRLAVLAHASNVCGTLQPIEEIAREAHARGVLFLVDAAQTAGHVPIQVRQMQIDLLAVPGHKGLLGPLGTGALYLRPGLEKDIQPLMEGGTGSVSERPVQPDFMPDKYESGSHNAIGLAGLSAALEWLENETVEALAACDRSISARFLEGAAGIDGLTVYGPHAARERVAVFSVRMAGLEPAELSALLETEFGILSRSGIHCAPLAHETLGTSAGGGTTRLSFGPFNTLSDVDRCIESLAQLAALDAGV